jgi:hypothetical protein
MLILAGVLIQLLNMYLQELAKSDSYTDLNLHSSEVRHFIEINTLL